jgi:heme oxygenase
MASTQEISPPSSDTEEVSWGSLYVIEGSALGGQIIARKLLLEFPGHLHRFFRLSHGGNRPTWKVFQGLMANQLSDAGSRRTIALQARATFRAFQRMLDAVTR